MSSTLLVPLQIDALCLEKDQLAIEASADFSRLPFQKDGADQNPNSLNISDTVLSNEFQNLNFTLKKGIHLHWAMPDGLTMGVQDTNKKIVYPQIPNRWLITKYINEKQEGQWIVESDYLHPQNASNDYGSVSYPIDLKNYTAQVIASEIEETPYQPYRFIGRQVPYVDWNEEESVDRLKGLTVAGYGTPSFAAFYPNCYSILGFQEDTDTTPDALNNTEYTVVGWYSDTSNDPLNKLIRDNSGKTIGEFRELIKGTFNWEIPEDADAAPENMVCFGHLSFNANTRSFESTRTTDVELAIGNSGKEALSAYMATKFHPDKKKVAEEQLMAIQLSNMVNTTGTDVGPAFRQAFHDDQFASKNGQTVWVVTLQSNTNNTTDKSSQNNKDENIQLPPNLTHQLNDLNLSQAAFEQSSNRIEGLRHSLFSDWYKYMVSAYPASDEVGAYPDMNLIRYYIEQKSIPELENLIEETGTLFVEKDKSTGIITSLKGEGVDTVAARVSGYFAGLKTLVDSYNTGEPEATYFTALCNQGAIPSDVTSDAGITWVPNTPITDQCLQFSGRNFLTYNISEGCRGISFWTKIIGQQNHDAVFFNLEEVDNSSIGVSGFGTFWNRVSINGVVINPEINKDWGSFPKDQWIHIYLESATHFNGNLYLLSSDGTQQFTRGNLTSFRLFNSPLSEDDIYTDRNIFQKNQAVIRQQPGPRYYQTKEPVLLLSGDDVKPSLRHGYDGRQHEEDLMVCNIDSTLVLPLTKAGIESSTILDDIRNKKPGNDTELMGYQSWEEMPWNPFMFEWETANYPLLKENASTASEESTSGSDALIASGGNYPISFIEDNFIQEMNKEQLALNDNATVSGDPQIYKGYTIITNQAQLLLQAQVIVFLNKQRTNDFIAQFGITIETEEQQTSFNDWIADKPKLSESNFEEYTDWIDSLPEYLYTDTPNNIIRQAIGAYTEVTQLNVQSQALGGFNQALLMFNQALQLPISDALGYDNAKEFAEKVADLVLGANKSVAHPLNTFMPLRTGSLNLMNVRIIDTFGQYKDVNNLEALIIPESMRFDSSEGYGHFYLPPAISQPARLNFRWLAADNGEQEVNSAQSSNPICGWVVANFMDLSIMVYDQNGYSLGYIDKNAFWQPTPGDSTPLDPRFIENKYLKNVVRQLSITDGESNEAKAQYILDFINMMNEALTNITPANAAQLTGTAILMGRPIAVVRTFLDLEVKGNLANNQSWNAFRADLNASKRTTNDFEKVLFPLRVGDRSQLNDGLVGYWKEDETNQLSSAFYTTIASGVVTNADIVAFEDARTHLQQSIDAEGQNLTMLVDPNGSVHAHSGVLPTKSIAIPSSKFAKAIQNINITFLSTPIITPRDLVAVSLPNEAGFNWSWVAKHGQTWKTVDAVGSVTINDFTIRFNNGLEIWDALVSNNWISTQDNATAQVIAENQRLTTDLGGTFSTQLVEIQKILTAAKINPFSYDGTFKNPVEAIEGWLKLTPQKS
ncbi:MAG: hypothetical protein R8G66_03835 [Cytophagales bacterium]|nr:hypothetical protein [Cytophagales bacterium]